MTRVTDRRSIALRHVGVCTRVVLAVALSTSVLQAQSGPPVIVVNPTPTDCFSGAGCLDPAFGTQGKVLQDMGDSLQWAMGVAAQTDGKVVVVGTRRLNTVPSNDSWAIARFNPDGTLDSGFAANGVATFDHTSGSGLEQARAVAIQPDGKIVVVGFGGSSPNYVAVVRYTPSGALDPTFGSGGKTVITSLGSGYILTSMAIQPDGKVVAVAGYNTSPASTSKVFRLKTNGAIDNTFGILGFRQVSTGYVSVMALQSNGGIILGGHNGSGDTTNFRLGRLSSSGAVDNQFGNRTLDFFGYEDHLSAIGIAADNSIVVGGRVSTAPWASYPAGELSFNMGFARFTATGTLVTSFGTNGKVVLDMHGGYDVASGLAVQSDGKIVLGGFASLSDRSNAYFIAGRLTSSGSLDTSFGTGGVTETSLAFDDRSDAMTLDANGGLYIVGRSYRSNPTNNPQTWLIARYFR